jgi:hypothetical protein
MDMVQQMKQSWTRWSKPGVDSSEDVVQVYAGNGYKTDWMIEKRTDCDKPYVLSKICTGQRYGTFNRLLSAKTAAFLFDFG